MNWDGEVKFANAEGWGSFINNETHAYTLVAAWNVTPQLTLTAVADLNQDRVYVVWDLENLVNDKWTYECHDDWPWEACCNSPVLAQNEPLDLALKLDTARTEMLAMADRMKNFLLSLDVHNRCDDELHAWVNGVNQEFGRVTA